MLSLGDGSFGKEFVCFSEFCLDRFVALKKSRICKFCNHLSLQGEWIFAHRFCFAVITDKYENHEPDGSQEEEWEEGENDCEEDGYVVG